MVQKMQVMSLRLLFEVISPITPPLTPLPIPHIFIYLRQAMLEPAAQQIEELRSAEKEVEDSLLREAERGGGGLSERETRDVWNMLQADRERILVLSRRLEAAQTRLVELGVQEEE